MVPAVSENIKNVCDRIVDMMNPEKIVLFSRKINVKGATVSFKLCVISETADKEQEEKRIYLQIDSEVPFDVVIYTPEEWSAHCGCKGSFAHRLNARGTVVYEKAQ